MQKEEELAEQEKAAEKKVFRKDFYQFVDFSPCGQNYGIAERSSLKEQE